MKAIIIYPQDRTFLISVPPSSRDNIPAILNYCWDATNPDSGDETVVKLNKNFRAFGTDTFGVRSSMVGDIFVFEYQGQTHYFMVDGLGFKQITEDQSILLQSLETRDLVMGWEWLQKKVPKLGEPVSVIG